MNIKSLLLGSAAALAAVSGAQAADAIVAAEPEPVEYVRVCDAFGTGYFYIPGTETCLKIGGFIRVQTNFAPNASGTSDWDSFSRAYISFDAKSDTEYGTLTGFFAAEFNADNDSAVGDSLIDVDEAYIQIGGLKTGFFYSWWDKGINGETDSLSTNSEFNSIAYIYDGGSFQAGVSVDELEAATTRPNGIGVAGIVSASLGGVSFDLLGGYDTETEEGAVRALLSADVASFGTFQLAGIYASGVNAYYSDAEWTVAGSFAIKATDKLTITPAAQYWSDVAFVNNVDQWRAGVTVGYQITDGLKTLATVNYTDNDRTGDVTTGFIRLQRDF
ncbi:porin [Rhizobium sp. SG2393]|uniref:porin n=1 Tax=Rhizobium sp. SG2393 TaxID=3276279 RepID=UPI00366EF5F3